LSDEFRKQIRSHDSIAAELARRLRNSS
jgi:hypothetical protein